MTSRKAMSSDPEVGHDCYMEKLSSEAKAVSALIDRAAREIWIRS